MTRFIELTKFATREPIFLNINKIYLFERQQSDRTLIDMGGEDYIYVTETPDTIHNMIYEIQYLEEQALDRLGRAYNF